LIGFVRVQVDLHRGFCQVVDTISSVVFDVFVVGWSAVYTPTSTFHGFVAHEPPQNHHLEFDRHQVYSRQSEIAALRLTPHGFVFQLQ